MRVYLTCLTRCWAIVLQGALSVYVANILSAMKYILHKAGRTVGSVVLVFLLNACSDSAEQRATVHLQKGREFLADGNIDKARIEFKNVLEITPKNADAHFLLGQVHEQREEWSKAFAQYKAAIALKPEHTEARLNLGRLYLRSGVPDQALLMANGVLEVQPERLEALQLQASAHMQRNEAEKAIVIAEHILQLAPDYTDTLVLLAVHYNRSGKPARAITLLEEAVSNNPNDSTLRYLLARSLGTTGQIQRATEVVLELIELEPGQLEHRVWLAVMYAREERMDEAQKVLDKMAEEFPDDLSARRMIAEFHVGHGDSDKAIEFLDRSLADMPGAYELRLYLAEQYERSGQQDSARETYQVLIDSGDSGIYGLTARNRLARLLSGMGEFDSAYDLITETLEANPRDNDALILRGKIALARNQPDDAVMNFRSVLKDQPYSAEVLGLLATAHLANHEPDLARETLERSVKGNPRDAQSRIALARLLVAQNQTRRAGELASEALNLAPGHLGAMDALARIRVSEGDWAGVLRVAVRMVEADPEKADGYLYSGLAQRGLGDVAKAVVSLSRAMALAPEDDAVLTAYVGALLAAGEPVEAQKRAVMFLDVRPDNLTAQNLLGEVLVFREDYVAAADAFRKAIALDARAAIPYRNLGQVLIAVGKEQEAQEVFRQGLKAVQGDVRSEAMLQSFLSSAQR
jgi:tetratricopeptide (TPR) repeat protein